MGDSPRSLEESTEICPMPRPSRGAAFGDVDNDGDIDVLVVNVNSRPSLYRNEGGNRKAWIGFRLIGSSSNRDAIGTRVEIDAGGRTQAGEVRSGGSYLSHNDMRIHSDWARPNASTGSAFDGLTAKLKRG
jgi:hypothetical protein